MDAAGRGKLVKQVALSDDQALVYRALCDEAGKRRLLTLGGYAGTGKTTLLGLFAAQAQQRKMLVAYVSYTGRASSVLQRKLADAGVSTTTLLRRTSEDALVGMAGSYYATDRQLGEHDGPPLCTTIHRLLYRPLIKMPQEELVGWREREGLDRKYDLIVVDEASMVSDEILQVIQSHGVPVLAVGDHGQLPPVAASGNLMKNPDLRLEKIHRQAEGSPIIQLAHHVREGGRLDGFGATWDMGSADGVSYATKRDIDVILRQAYAQTASSLDVAVLCWTNKMRVKLNGLARKAIGFKGAPSEKEIVICLRNRPPVYNGMRGVVRGTSLMDAKQPWIMHSYVEFPDEGIGKAHYSICAAQFNRERPFASVEELNDRGIDVMSMPAAGDLYDFGYAMTVHKAQGSQFDTVIVFLDRPEKTFDDDWRRWIYTAVTRSARKLIVVR